ncbi:MAG: hypothetical protein D6785_06795, partial [Planctomycetota bacterium]
MFLYQNFWTYSMNVHPLACWEDLQKTIQDHVLPLKKGLARHGPMGLGLWLPENMVFQLLENPGKKSKLIQLLKSHDLYVFTMNGFPQKDFHQKVVKEAVYKPNWMERERLEYSKNLAKLLADFLPSFVPYGTISTLPLGFKSHDISMKETFPLLAELVEYLFLLEQEKGKHICFGLEPEPYCLLERTEEVLHFFERFRSFGETWALERGYETGWFERICQKFLGVCFDCCHQGVEFENIQDSLTKLVEQDIRIVKVQLSSALVYFPKAGGLSPLLNFQEPKYLHQTFGRLPDGRLISAPDLALLFEENTSLWEKAEEIRVHFHIPLFHQNFGSFHSTYASLKAALEFFSTSENMHFEIETYTWDVLPKALRESMTLSECLQKEYNQV